MRQKFGVLVLTIGLSFLTIVEASDKAVMNDDQQVRALIGSLADAGMKRDVVAIDRIYSDDYFHTNADGSIMMKEQVLVSYRAPASATFDSNVHTEDKVIIHGDLAVVSGTTTLKGQMRDQPFARTWRITYTLQKRDGTWQIVASHASIIS